MKKEMPFLLLLFLSVCAHSQTYYQVPSVVATAWEPSTNQVHQALSAVKQYCMMELSDSVLTIKRAQAEEKMETTVSNDTIIISFDSPPLDTNSIPHAFKVYGLPYSEFELNIGPFLETGTTRFIAVQHLISTKVRSEVKGSRPFTVYYNVENGKIGLYTASTWDDTKNNGMDRVRMIYSPGPPYFISTAGF